MVFALNNKSLKYRLSKLGQILFFIGIFFLPSTIFIASLFLLPAAILSTFLNKKDYLKDNWNNLFLTCGALMILTVLLQVYVLKNLYFDIWDSNLSLIGLANWIPYFWLFWSFQPYLKDQKKRKNSSLVAISGTLPLLISGFGQYFFDWNGPWSTLNGLIIWFQKPLSQNDGLTGLFSNPNYTGSWLLFIWPFCIAFFLIKTQNYFKKTIAICFLTSVGTAAFLTNSRNAWGGLFMTVPIILGTESFIWIGSILIIIFFIISICVLPVFEGELQNFIRLIIPEKVWLEFSKKGFEYLDVTRMQIFLSSIKISILRPIFGIGASSFTTIYLLRNGIWRGHSHNLIIELSISYGIPIAIFLTSIILCLLFKSGKLLFFSEEKHDNDLFDKAWWASIFIFSISQLVDIQYFEGRISIFTWILLSGIKKIIDEKNEYSTIKQVNKT